MSKYAPRIINVDNQGAIALAENPIHHARTKHLDIQLQFVHDHIKRNTIKLQYCPTNDMLADIMTKALAKDRHAKLCELIGMARNGVMEMGKETPENDEWECGITPFSAETRTIVRRAL